MQADILAAPDDSAFSLAISMARSLPAHFTDCISFHTPSFAAVPHFISPRYTHSRQLRLLMISL
jgi:hypothetical protein